MISTEVKKLAEAIRATIPQDAVAYYQAVSVCSVFTENEICEASYEDIADRLTERFGSIVERSFIDKNVINAVQAGVEADLMEVEDGMITLTLDGILAGEEWFNALKLNK